MISQAPGFAQWVGVGLLVGLLAEAVARFTFKNRQRLSWLLLPVVGGALGWLTHLHAHERAATLHWFEVEPVGPMVSYGLAALAAAVVVRSRNDRPQLTGEAAGVAFLTFVVVSTVASALYLLLRWG